MKTQSYYVQEASNAVWILNKLLQADKDFCSGDPIKQSKGAKERAKYLTKWENWRKANPEVAKTVVATLNGMITEIEMEKYGNL